MLLASVEMNLMVVMTATCVLLADASDRTTSGMVDELAELKVEVERLKQQLRRLESRTMDDGNMPMPRPSSLASLSHIAATATCRCHHISTT